MVCGFAVGHTLAELLFGHLADGDGAFGEAFAVAAVCAGDVIGQLKRGTCTGGGAFLSHRHVRRAAIIEIANRFVSARTELDDHFFQLADDQHVFQNCDGLGGGDCFCFKFGGEIALVAISGNFATIYFERREFRPRITQIYR